MFYHFSMPPLDHFAYFFALLPPAAVVAEIAIQRDRAIKELPGGIVDDARLHVSVLGLGAFPTPQQGLVALAHAALADRRLPACCCYFDQLVRGRKSMLLVSSRPHDDMAVLQAALQDAYHVPDDDRSKTLPKPHVTLRYDQREAPTQAIAPIVWHAEELVLIESHVGHSHHRVLGRWPLQQSFEECFDWVSA